MFFGVPTMYARLVDAHVVTHLRGCRLLVSGSAPLPTDLFSQIANAAGQAPLERYGMTETVMITGNPLHGERRAGSVGKALPGVEVRLGVDDVVEVRGPNVFAGYAGVDPLEVFTSDGWFPTGDLGNFDADGYLNLVGRASELIITGGYNVYPREVEEVLRQHPAVVDVAVIGRPSREWGEVVTAIVVGDASIAELQEISAASLAPYKKPRAFEFTSELPRNAMGKIDRSRL
jgi:malonyl-CoA/methylmalonyl-CoA synthetase